MAVAPLARIVAALIASAWLAQPAATSEQDITASIPFNEGARTYRLFVPAGAGAKQPAPAVVLFNGSGSSVEPLFKYWKEIARREGVVLIGPSAFAPGAWRIPEDSPEFTGRAVEDVKTRVSIDPRRVYLFGHSGGAGHVLLLGLFESEYFAAVAAHAGVLRGEDAQFLDLPQRKMPFAIWVGTKDQLVPLRMARITYDVLSSRDFPIALHEIKGHTHSFAEKGDEVTAKAWEFLRGHHLSKDPKFYLYKFNPRPTGLSSLLG